MPMTSSARRILILILGISLAIANIYISVPFNSSAGPFQNTWSRLQSVMFVLPLLIIVLASIRPKANPKSVSFALFSLWLLGVSVGYIVLTSSSPSMGGALLLVVNLLASWGAALMVIALM